RGRCAVQHAIDSLVRRIEIGEVQRVEHGHAGFQCQPLVPAVSPTDFGIQRFQGRESYVAAGRQLDGLNVAAQGDQLLRGDYAGVYQGLARRRKCSRNTVVEAGDFVVERPGRDVPSKGPNIGPRQNVTRRAISGEVILENVCRASGRKGKVLRQSAVEVCGGARPESQRQVNNAAEGQLVRAIQAAWTKVA